MKINIKSDIKDLARSITDLIGPDGFKRAFRNSINATATQIKKSLPVETSNVWNVTQTAVSKTVSAVRTSREGLEASVNVSSPPVGAINFATSPTPLQHWKTIAQRPEHKVELYLKHADGSKELIDPKIKGKYTMVGKPFIASMPDGHKGVFVRVTEKGRATKLARRALWKDTPWKWLPADKQAKIVQVNSIPIAGMVKNKTIVEIENKLTDEVFLNKLEEQIDKQLEKLQKKNKI